MQARHLQAAIATAAAVPSTHTPRAHTRFFAVMMDEAAKVQKDLAHKIPEKSFKKLQNTPFSEFYFMFWLVKSRGDI